ncbi:Wzz/FepE/Etk N-terminal domain-containing protein [Spongiactinospora sp. TRM90649]|uniref:Wzz/FepE/Etk N-terminal domain-containing protein n=1 Tax=Spongiactinospora sp. TRM90649 TaxID=3031114 RepID=UPI0023F6CEF5|nr:Wzz/FepE/Etk N-terminal domain-containing protein [Spongiactinospora sp. TRM90649]MDF5754801.1 Wzz/FepE/Etk N-terminal domain-containing protein [Spongiactinospora sp. TRM90649]
MSLSPDFPDRGSGTELSEYTSLLRRRWLIFFFCLASGFTGGAALLRYTPSSYTATTQVLVSPTGVNDQINQLSGRQRESLNLDTEAQIAQSAVVAEKAATNLKPSALAEPVPAATIAVAVPPNSAVLSISATAATPASAAAHARAYAEAYLQQRTEAAQRELGVQLKALSAKLKQVNADLGEIATSLPGLARGSAERTIAQQQQDVLSRQVYNLTAKYDTLRTVAITPGSVISEAVPPGAPSAPSAPLHLGSGLMLGLLAGAGAAFARDRLDTRLRGARDVERLTGIPVIAGPSGVPGGRDPDGPHELASTLIAARPGGHLLIRPVGADFEGRQLTRALAGPLAPTRVLNGDGLHDLARAETAVLLVSLRGVSAREVATAAQALRRTGTRLIGAIVLRPARRRVRRAAAEPPTNDRPSPELEKPGSFGKPDGRGGGRQGSGAEKAPHPPGSPAGAPPPWSASGSAPVSATTPDPMPGSDLGFKSTSDSRYGATPEPGTRTGADFRPTSDSGFRAASEPGARAGVELGYRAASDSGGDPEGGAVDAGASWSGAGGPGNVAGVGKFGAAGRGAGGFWQGDGEWPGTAVPPAPPSRTASRAESDALGATPPRRSEGRPPGTEGLGRLVVPAPGDRAPGTGRTWDASHVTEALITSPIHRLTEPSDPPGRRVSPTTDTDHFAASPPTGQARSAPETPGDDASADYPAWGDRLDDVPPTGRSRWADAAPPSSAPHPSESPTDHTGMPRLTARSEPSAPRDRSHGSGPSGDGYTLPRFGANTGPEAITPGDERVVPPPAGRSRWAADDGLDDIGREAASPAWGDRLSRTPGDEADRWADGTSDDEHAQWHDDPDDDAEEEPTAHNPGGSESGDLAGLAALVSLAEAVTPAQPFRWEPHGQTPETPATDDDRPRGGRSPWHEM